MYAEVSFPISSWRIFTYRIPQPLDGLIQTGIRVKAPLGRRKAVQGVVVGLGDKAKFKGKIQFISEVVDDVPVLDDTLWQLISWVSDYYLTPLGQVMRSAVPSGLSQQYEPPQILEVSAEKISSGQLQELKGKAPKQYNIVQAISNRGGTLFVKDLADISDRASTICRSLEKKGLVAIRPITREPELGGLKVTSVHKEIELTDEQQEVVDEIMKSMKQNLYSASLLHGVTGSGKTEVYIYLARAAQQLGRTSIILLPEISLTPQIAGRFWSVFGEEVAIWHSRMTSAERSWTWRQICAGKYSVVVGARSAIFTPMKKVGLIVVDEEQEGSFKQENPAPRYHARDVALMRGKLSDAITLLAGATPSMESYYNQVTNKLNYIRLSSRYGDAVYPRVHLVDMNDERAVLEDYSIVLSRKLTEKIAERMERGEQVILLQNRRGFASVVTCVDCSEVEMCKHCQIVLTFHKSDSLLKCHYCNFQKPVPKLCAKCDGTLRLGGTGTQKVEEVLIRKFPNIKFVRMDMDTTRRKGAFSKILKEFGEGRYDVLLGTQMIAKGLDFPNVTLVGVVNADTGLFLPDFRSGERTFQLIYQVAGRSGRGIKPGEAIIQTSHPDDPVIKSASQLDIEKYYDICLNERKELMYAPFSWMARVEFSGPDEKKVCSTAENHLKKISEKPQWLKIMGPAPCPVERLRGNYRYQIIFKSPKKKDKNGALFHTFLKQNFTGSEQKGKEGNVRVTMDVDPISLL